MRQLSNSSRAAYTPWGQPSRSAISVPESTLSWSCALRSSSSSSLRSTGSALRSSLGWYRSGAGSISQGQTHMGSSPSGSESKTTMVFSHGSSPPRTRCTRPSQNSLPLSPMMMPVLPGMRSPGLTSAGSTIGAGGAAAAGASGAPSAVGGAAGAAASTSMGAAPSAGGAPSRTAGTTGGAGRTTGTIGTAPGASASTVPSSNSMTILACLDQARRADRLYRSQSMM